MNMVANEQVVAPDEDVVAMAGQGFVDGVIHNFEDQVVQARAVGGIAVVPSKLERDLIGDV